MEYYNSLIKAMLAEERAAAQWEAGALHDEDKDFGLLHILDAMPGGFFMYRADEGEEIIYANTALLRLFGCENSREFRELTGNSFRGIVHPEDYEQVEASIFQQIDQSQYDLDYVEYRIVTRQGETRWVEDYGHYVESESFGRLFYVFIGDATAKHQRQEDERQRLLQESQVKEQQLQDYSRKMQVINQEHLRRLEMIEGLSVDYESIFYVDLKGDTIKLYRTSSRIRQALTTDKELHKYSKFVEYYVNKWVHPDDRAMMAEALDPANIRKRLAACRTFYTNYRIVQEGMNQYLQLRLVNAGSGRDISQIIVGSRSVDEEIRSEMRQKDMLNDALSRANLAMVAKNAFLANMSHDIRTPMNAILGFMELAKKHVDDREKLKNYLDLIQNSSQQLLQIINDVLEITRSDAGKGYIAESACNLLQIASRLQETFCAKAAAKRIALHMDTSQVSNGDVYTDSLKLQQVLSRIVSNAIKYTQEGGLVQVTFAEQEQSGSHNLGISRYRFIVEDNGSGISEDFLPHIFEPFERQSNSTLSGVPGTGLGLTIVKNIVDLLEGTIDVESQPGRGSRFTVNLALRTQEEQPALPPAEVQGPELKLRLGKVLVVDDNELNLEIELELLREAGFMVEPAHNGKVALDKLAASDPGEYGLVLMDIQMPVMDGYQAAREIRALPDPSLARIPIMALSANTFEEDRRRSLECGMSAHLAKPIDIPCLLEAVGKIMGTVS